MEASPVEDAVTPSVDQSKAIFEHGFSTWTRCFHQASIAPKQAISSFLANIDHAYPEHPPLPPGMTLSKSSSSWLATGVSTWATLAADGSSKAAHCHDPPVLPPQKRNIAVTKNKPTKIKLTSTNDSDSSCENWPELHDHIAVLVLAWAYVLSAKWTEIVPGANPISYTETQRNISRKAAPITSLSIGPVCDEAKRWWEAVLAPGQGWLATVATLDGSTLSSPWSTRLSSTQTLLPIFSESGEVSTTGTAAGSTAALKFLAEYCHIHHLQDESRAALSTVLFLPSARHLSISAPKHSSTGPCFVRPRLNQSTDTNQLFPSTQLGRLMALSCNSGGIEALLLSTFFDPSVPCNAVSPFLQGTFTVLDGIVHDRALLMCTLMHRAPKVSFLWAGAMISGTCTALLEKARYGLLECDLLVAAWTGTVHTFMQMPVSCSASGRVQRDDECRLMYLTGASYQRRLPMTPWRPFGTTALKDAELEVQTHADCQGHSLIYQSWVWDGCKEEKDNKVNYPPSLVGPATAAAYESPLQGDVSYVPEVPYEKMCPEDDSASCSATLNMFVWLRSEGFPRAEQHIRRHEWLCETLDEEEHEAYESWPESRDGLPARKRNRSTAPKPVLGSWLASTQARRESSI